MLANRLSMTSSTSSQPSSSLLSDDELTKQLQQLRSQLNKKQSFESAISSLKKLLIESYPNSSATVRSSFYDVVCRVATVVRTRYTFPAYLIAGVELLELAESVIVNSAEKSHLKSCISSIRQSINDQTSDENGVNRNSSNNGRYLFEGHLTVDQEPPQPNWLVQQNLLTALASQSQNAENINGGSENENISNLMRSLVESLDVSMMENLEDFLPLMEGVGAGGRRAAPPASKEVVEKLRVIKVESDEMLKNKFGEEGGECCICKEKLRVGDQMQEMPCKHVFHPPCLKPWLDEHNSCPICRHELPTDDHKYESWKEREKELEEERRGAANAVRGGSWRAIITILHKQGILTNGQRNKAYPRGAAKQGIPTRCSETRHTHKGQRNRAYPQTGSETRHTHEGQRNRAYPQTDSETGHTHKG